jgi:hypothetical protein
MRHSTLTPFTRTVITRMKRAGWAAALGGLVVTVGVAPPARALDCAQIDIPGARSTTAYAINTPGDIVGQFVDAKNVSHGFLIDHRSGQFTVVDVPGATLTQANGINPQGDMVGRYNDGSGAHGWLWSDGQFSTIQFPGSTLTAASQINARGDIVGRYSVGTDGHGFTLIDGVYASVDVPGATGTNVLAFNGTSAFGIDESGDVSGFYVTSDGVSHGFMIRHVYGWGSSDSCGNAASGGAVAGRANMRGGWGLDYSCFRRPVLITIDSPGALYEDGLLTQFDYEGAATTEVFGVNARGEFVGRFNTDGGPLFHGYVCR